MKYRLCPAGDECGYSKTSDPSHHRRVQLARFHRYQHERLARICVRKNRFPINAAVALPILYRAKLPTRPLLELAAGLRKTPRRSSRRLHSGTSCCWRSPIATCACAKHAAAPSFRIRSRRHLAALARHHHEVKLAMASTPSARFFGCRNAVVRPMLENTSDQTSRSARTLHHSLQRRLWIVSRSAHA
jgi:hypothetical protein